MDRPTDFPEPAPDLERVWGSDAMASVLRALDIPFAAINPGASYRGLHDSLVNYLGNRRPELLLCLHEESAVAIAHGYAKVAGRPMAAILHSNVGLMHGSMGIFNAWCDRVPMLVLGATGPVDADRRRPWIDWIHTAQDQAALVRSFIKWDDQPASVPAAMESLLRAVQRATTAPCGPAYVCLDAALQEQALPAMPTLPDVARFRAPPAPEPAAAALDEAVRLLDGAARPVILMGRVSRDPTAWDLRRALAERLGAGVVTDLKCGASFPTDHPLHLPGPAMFLSPRSAEQLARADVILSLDWIDLAGTLKTAYGAAAPPARIIQVSMDHHAHNGWAMDHFGLPPVDVFLQCEPDIAVAGILPRLRRTAPAPAPVVPPMAGDHRSAERIDVPGLIAGVRAAVGERPACLVRAPLSWRSGLWQFGHPLDYLGYDGGGGVGSGPGMTVGAALALRGSGRMPVSILGDGDFLMGVTAIWTAVHYSIPMLAVIANNRSFFNDELHQERVARARSRPVANRWIGQAIRDPDVDIAGMARAQGAEAIGPVRNPAELPAALARAVALVERGKCVVVDVEVEPGYDPDMAKALSATEGKRKG